MRPENAYEKLLLAIATRASGRGILLLAGLLYAGGGLALPLAAGWSVPWLVFANVIGTLLAGTLLLIWLAVQVHASKRRNLIEWTTDLRRLDSEEFEWLVGEMFRREGWGVEETGRRDRPDGGIDLKLHRGREQAIVQCKRWTARQIGVEAVRAFSGTLTREGMPTKAGVFVTLSSFTPQAVTEGKQLGLTLVDSVDLYGRVEKVRRPKGCPKCGSPMLLDRSPRGWWFRCVTARCDGKEDLGADPAGAVSLLTQPPG